MTNPVNKLADGIRSLMHRGKEENPYLEDDSFFADEPDDDDMSAPLDPLETEPEDPPKKKKGFHLPSFRKNKEEQEEAPKPEPETIKQSAGDSRKKKRLLFACSLLVLASGFGYAYFFMDDGIESTSPPSSQIAVNNQKKPNTNEKKDASQAPQAAAPLVNPFVDISLLKKAGANPDGTIPTMGNEAPVPATSLPSIPNSSYPRYTENPRPSLPAIPSLGSLPSVPNVPSSAPQGPAARPNEVQGVITGSDGQNMAIMGDGTIVSEGETDNDGRIAYIGGDGIKFDDGSSLDYK